MGASEFETTAKGKTADKAFKVATEGARYEYGHGGYTGTIAEKDDFREFEIPEGMTAAEVIKIALDVELKVPPQHERHRKTLEAIYETADDKWGPAACLKTGKDEFTFFGLASC
jgi:hypothetical protein